MLVNKTLNIKLYKWVSDECLFVIQNTIFLNIIDERVGYWFHIIKVDSICALLTCIICLLVIENDIPTLMFNCFICEPVSLYICVCVLHDVPRYVLKWIVLQSRKTKTTNLNRWRGQNLFRGCCVCVRPV